jgi:hypothetical protein
MQESSRMCLCSVMSFDSIRGSTHASWHRLIHVRPFGHTHDTCGVGALCDLRSMFPFDYVDSAVLLLGLG